MPCAHCPVGPDRICPATPRLCQLADPAHPDYDPRYRDAIPLHAQPRESGGESPAARVEYPPLATQAVNLAGAFWDWAISGFTMASDEEQARRRSICATCPRWDASGRRCTLCGCYTEAKIQLKTSHCPDDPSRW